MSHDLASKLAERLWCIAEERIGVDLPCECAAPLLVCNSGRPEVRPWKLDRTCIVIAGFFLSLLLQIVLAGHYFVLEASVWRQYVLNSFRIRVACVHVRRQNWVFFEFLAYFSIGIVYRDVE